MIWTQIHSDKHWWFWASISETELGRWWWIFQPIWADQQKWSSDGHWIWRSNDDWSCTSQKSKDRSLTPRCRGWICRCLSRLGNLWRRLRCFRRWAVGREWWRWEYLERLDLHQLRNPWRSNLFMKVLPCGLPVSGINVQLCFPNACFVQHTNPKFWLCNLVKF